MCHILLLLPIVALPVFVLLPWQEALLVYIGVTALSVLLYLLMWRDVRRPPSTGIKGMMGGRRSRDRWLRRDEAFRAAKDLICSR